tara:strand:- start:499 stop:1188 length:690 start_codon:yes stop_codon:yes gene_type:complete
MNWDDTGYLLSKNKYNENSLIVEFFTRDHGKITGIVFGGTSKKIKNYLQIGNQLFINYNSKTENRIGYFKVEILKAYSPLFFDNSQKLNCMSSAMNLIKILTADSQSNLKVFNLINDFYNLLSKKDWLKRYIHWELEFLSNLGYNLNLNEIANKKIIDNKVLYIVESFKEKKIVPNFLINKDENVDDINILLTGLKLVGDFMDKNILKPNNINFPHVRNYFVQSLKQLD